MRIFRSNCKYNSRFPIVHGQSDTADRIERCKIGTLMRTCRRMLLELNGRKVEQSAGIINL